MAGTEPARDRSAPDLSQTVCPVPREQRPLEQEVRQVVPGRRGSWDVGVQQPMHPRITR